MTSIHISSLEPFEPRAKHLMDVHPTDDGTDDENLASKILSSHPRVSVKSFYPSKASLDNRPEDHWIIREVVNGEEEEGEILNRRMVEKGSELLKGVSE